MGTHGWTHRGILPVPASPLNREAPTRRPFGAHFSPFNFSVIGPSVPTHGPLGRRDERSRGAERHSEGGGQTDEHVAYVGAVGGVARGGGRLARRHFFSLSDHSGLASPRRLNPPPSPLRYEAQEQFVNSGLVLNNVSQARQLDAQSKLLDALQADLDWCVPSGKTFRSKSACDVTWWIAPCPNQRQYHTHTCTHFTPRTHPHTHMHTHHRSAEYRETAIMDAAARARLDVQRLMQDRLDHLNARYDFEYELFQNLSASQCSEEVRPSRVSKRASPASPQSSHSTNPPPPSPALPHHDPDSTLPPPSQRCEIHFDTSELRLSGAINDWGVAATTDQGTEVAVFAFDSIELGPEIVVKLTGQRALVLLSRSSVVLNTTLNATPGTLGGFPGGFSWGRNVSHALWDHPDDFHPSRLEGDSAMVHPVAETDTVARGGDTYGNRIQQPGSGGAQAVPEGVPSNNVNGPGSGNVRVYLQTVTTSADDVDEVQTITTTADQEQTLGGGFKLQYAWPGSTCQTRWGQDPTTMAADPTGCWYTTRLIPHDASAAKVKAAIEQGLNANQVCVCGGGGGSWRSRDCVSSRKFVAL